jgi:hypothetical protein
MAVGLKRIAGGTARKSQVITFNELRRNAMNVIRTKIARALRGLFHETVLQLALFGAVIVAVVDGVTSLNRGTFV